MAKSRRKTLYDGKHIRLMQGSGWEWVERRSASGVVCIVAVTDKERLIVIEQQRPPLGKSVIELPAGLAGDTKEFAGEELAAAAGRELMEETGYVAAKLTELGTFASSAGLTNETVTFFAATSVKRAGKGGGDGSENITVHEVKLSGVDAWLRKHSRGGKIVDARVYTGLYLLNKRA